MQTRRRMQLKPQFDWKHLLNNAYIQNQFIITHQNHFSHLLNEDGALNPSNTYINFINSHKHAAEEFIPLKSKTKHKVSWQNEIVEDKQKCLIKIAKSKKKTPYGDFVQTLLSTGEHVKN